MEVRNSSKSLGLDSTKRLPLAPAERNSNAPPPPPPFSTAARRPRRDVNARYKSPTTPRFPSPIISTRTSSSPCSPKRAQSAERRRMAQSPTPMAERRRVAQSPTPISPRTSTPVKDSLVDDKVTATASISNRRLSIGGGGGKLPESLWPSTMRSLSVSFQSDSISVPVSKKEKEKPLISSSSSSSNSSNVVSSSDRTLKPSSNVATPSTKTIRVETPRRSSPLKGRSENGKPLVDSFQTKLIDQHRWPSRISSVKASTMSMNKSVDLSDIKSMRGLATPVVSIGTSTLKKMPGGHDGIADAVTRPPLQKSASDAATRILSPEEKPAMKAFDEVLERLSRAEKLVSANLPDRMAYLPSVRTHSVPSPRSRPASPSKISVSRGGSPSRTRPSTPSSRGVSPSRARTSSSGMSSPSSFSSNSVLSFVADYKRGKRSASYLEDAHQLRLLHNRHLQWRFANAQQEDVLYAQKLNTERTLCDVWNGTSSLWDSVIRKRIDLQKLKLELKLTAILNGQMEYLDDWGLVEREHVSSLSGAVEDLEASTLRLPLAGGAKADIESLKLAVCSAVDVMQAMGSSICYLLSKAEAMNQFVTDLAIIAAREKLILGECESLLASTAAMQVEEGSIRTHLIQMRQILENQAMLTTRTHQWWS
ncbi:AUGMIN subunit 8 [Linum grandiflorum]